jgi:hypothetical protein
MRVTVYSSPGSDEGDVVLQLLQALTPDYGLELTRVDIADDALLLEKYGGREPVVELEGGTLGRLYAPIEEVQLRIQLEIARRALQPRPRTQPEWIENGPGGNEGEWREPAIARAASYVGRRWLRFVSIAMLVYVGLPWLAPVFASLDWWAFADPIYGAYAFT